jgi:hypothetical protein
LQDLKGFRWPFFLPEKRGILVECGSEVHVKPNEEVEARLVLPALDCTIRGMAVNQDGSPKTDVLIGVDSEVLDIKVLPDKDGHFQFAAPAGTHKVRAGTLPFNGASLYAPASWGVPR